MLVNRLMQTLLVCLATTLSAVAADPDYARIIADSYPADGPGAAALVMVDGEIEYRGASGMADLELGVPLTADNVFRIGSISKQFTAAAIMLLQERGKLSVKDNINNHLPGYPTHSYTITIENLLTHTSGIYNYTNIPGYWEGGKIRADIEIDELIDMFKLMPMNFAPGTAYSYSNSGYILLGAIIEKISGQSYATFIEENFFQPLGMRHSYYGGHKVIPNRAHGYNGTPGDFSNAGYLSMSHAHAAGALLSTVDDLALWSRALLSHEMLSKDSVDAMITDYKLSDGELAGYGYGLGIEKAYGVEAIAHSGGIHGFLTDIRTVPDRDIFVAVLTNWDDHHEGPTYLSSRLAFEAAGVEYPVLDEIEISVGKLQDYVGVYRISDDETRTVSIDDGQIFTQRTDGGMSEIKAHDDDAFFYPGSFTHLTFKRNRAGDVVGMDVYQEGSQDAEPAELTTEEAADGRAVVAVSPDYFDLLAGDYMIDDAVTLAVRREGDSLFAQMTGQGEFELLPESTTLYFVPSVGADVQFVIGDDGRATKLTIIQNGEQTPGERID